MSLKYEPASEPLHVSVKWDLAQHVVAVDIELVLVLLLAQVLPLLLRGLRFRLYF